MRARNFAGLTEFAAAKARSLWMLGRTQKEGGNIWEECREGNEKKRAAFCQHAPASSVPTATAISVRRMRRRRRYQVRLLRAPFPFVPTFKRHSYLAWSRRAAGESQ